MDASGPVAFQLLGEKSPGVQRIEAISATFTKWTKVSHVEMLMDGCGEADGRAQIQVFLFVGVFLIAYAYGLDGTVRYTYQVSRSIACARILSLEYRRTPRIRMRRTPCWPPSMSCVPLSLRLPR